MKRLLFWLQRKKRLKEKHCGCNCLTCKYYEECIEDESSLKEDFQ